jgi:hypothetical protein
MTFTSVRHAAAKATKDEVLFGKGTLEAHCGLCAHHMAELNACQKVQGRDIMADDWCNLFARKEISTTT